MWEQNCTMWQERKGLGWSVDKIGMTVCVCTLPKLVKTRNHSFARHWERVLPRVQGPSTSPSCELNRLAPKRSSWIACEVLRNKFYKTRYGLYRYRG